MTASVRFPSLFFRQDLNSIGIPFLAVSFLLLLFLHWSVVLLASLCALLFLFFAIFFRKGESGRIFLLASLGVALALLSYGFHLRGEERAAKMRGQTLTAEGYITQTEKDSAVLSVYSVSGKPSFEKILIKGKHAFHQGDKLKGEVLLSASSEKNKEEGIDLASYDFSLERVGKSYFLSFVASLRTAFAENLGTHRAGGFYRAILLGDKNFLSAEDEEAFRRADSSHLLAISGLHISFLFGLVYFFIRYLPLGKRLRYALILPIIFLLFFFTDGSVSVFRASVMAAFPLVGKFFSRRSDSVTALVFAACLLAFFNPRCLLTPSFLLSFAATFSIVYASSHLVEALERKIVLCGRLFRLLRKIFLYFLSALVISSVLFVFTFPVQVLLFDEIRPLAPLFAVVLIPLFSPCLLFGVFKGIFFFVPFLSSAIATVSDGYATFYLDLVHSLARVAFEPVAAGSAGFFLALFVLALLLGGVIAGVRVKNLLYLYLGIVLLSLSASFLLA